MRYRSVPKFDLFRLAFVKSMTSIVMSLTLNCGEAIAGQGDDFQRLRLRVQEICRNLVGKTLGYLPPTENSCIITNLSAFISKPPKELKQAH